MIREALHSLLPDRAAFGILTMALGPAVQRGTLIMFDPWGERHIFGSGDAPRVSVRLTDPQTPTRLLAEPMLAAGEAYMDGSLILEEGSLCDFLMIGVAVCDEIAKKAKGTHAVVTPLRKSHYHNPIARSRANVAHHYDLSEDLYRIFLDPDMQYSCAYFQDGDEDLDLAQAKKKRHIASKLRLKPGARVLDIGSGWGGLALELARLHAVEVDGLTLSQEQLKVAATRATLENLDASVRFHLRDYREESGTYDRIVSVGMLEHVGALHFAEFFGVVSRLLAPDGIAVIHAIGRKDPPGENDAWIDRYIFPGGYCPSLSEVFAGVEPSGLWVTDMEVLTLHYAETLRCWSERFQAQRDRAAKLYDERFCRMWEFYLAACEAGFRAGPLMVFQIQLARSVTAVPQTRDYMVDEERRLTV
jgi:cyclopropane-fatty-acyl-phospholipid synthase